MAKALEYHPDGLTLDSKRRLHEVDWTPDYAKQSAGAKKGAVKRTIKAMRMHPPPPLPVMTFDDP